MDVPSTITTSVNTKKQTDSLATGHSDTVDNSLKENDVECVGCHCKVTTRLSCPTCLKLGLSDSIFCSQKCFKENWLTHKSFHKAMVKYMSRTRFRSSNGYDSLAQGYKEDNRSTWKNDTDLCHFDRFNFTGTLRPWPRTPMRPVPETIAKPDYYLTGYSIGEDITRESNKIEIRTPEEIERLRECCIIARKALDLAHSMVKPGVTTDAIDAAVHSYIIDMNGYPSPLNYCGFPKSCCTSINEVVCHGIPDLRPLKDGDIINIDITVYYKGMHGDLNETYTCGTSHEEDCLLIKGAYDAMMCAIAECRPGMMYRDIGLIISNIVEKRGLSVVRSYCGHGIGTLFHTAPNVPHYRRNKAIGIMKPGHVFTIEPMINLGGWKDETWPDQWTSVTLDGKRSAQFEHTLLVTETGIEILTARLPTSPPLEIDVPSENVYFQKKDD